MGYVIGENLSVRVRWNAHGRDCVQANETQRTPHLAKRTSCQNGFVVAACSRWAFLISTSTPECIYMEADDDCRISD